MCTYDSLMTVFLTKFKLTYKKRKICFYLLVTVIFFVGAQYSSYIFLSGTQLVWLFNLWGSIRMQPVVWRVC